MMNRRLLLQSVAVGVPVAVVSSVVARAVSDPHPAIASAAEAACQPSAGRVVFWGEQRNGNIGSENYLPYQSLIPPVPASLQSGVTAIAATANYLFALKGGRVHGFGYCECTSGNLDGDRVWNIPSAATAGVTAISAGSECVLALREGRVIGWGRASTGVAAVPEAARSGVTAIACGVALALAIKDGGVIQWGTLANMPPVPEAAKSGVVAIAAYTHALALKADGSVVAWGPPGVGPAIQVPEEARSGVTAIDAGGGGSGLAFAFSLAVKNGRVIGWGNNSRGQLNAPEDSDVVAVAAGDNNGMSLTRRGTVNVWSINNQRQVNVPDDLCNATAIAIGAYMCAAIV